MRFKMGELFCGPGGLAYGARQATLTNGEDQYEVESIWANDIETSSCQTFARNILGDDQALVKTSDYETSQHAAMAASRLPKAVICGDVRQLCIAALPKINAFAFGFPCNDFSTVGEQLGMKGEYGPLYTHGIQVLQYHKPLWFIAENVSGLASNKNLKAFERIASEMQGAGEGYKLTVHRYQFEQYGVPQTRQRIIIVGIRRDLNLTYRVPRPTILDSTGYQTARQALANIPADADNHETFVLKPTVQARIDSLLPGENAWNDRVPEEHRLHVKGAHLSQIYRVLDPDKPAYTVTANGGGGTHGYHWDIPRRALTNRERARLQTFPDDFYFCGNKQEVRSQVGMAVPPLAAKIIVEAIFKTFAGVDYPYVNATWEVSRGTQKTHLMERKSKFTKPNQAMLPMDVDAADQVQATMLETPIQTTINYASLPARNGADMTAAPPQLDYAGQPHP